MLSRYKAGAESIGFFVVHPDREGRGEGDGATAVGPVMGAEYAAHLLGANDDSVVRAIAAADRTPKFWKKRAVNPRFAGVKWLGGVKKLLF